MQFKKPELEQELENAPVFLKIILEDADQFLWKNFRKELTITRIRGKIKGDSGVHNDYRAADARGGYLGQAQFSQWEIAKLMRYINEKYYRNDGYKTVIYHSFNNGPEHFHFQLARDTKTYMRGTDEQKGPGGSAA